MIRLTRLLIPAVITLCALSGAAGAQADETSFHGRVLASEYRNLKLPAFSVRAVDGHPNRFSLSTGQPIVFESRRTGVTTISGITGFIERQCDPDCSLLTTINATHVSIGSLPVGYITLTAVVPTDLRPREWLGRVGRGQPVVTVFPKGTQLRLAQTWDKGDMDIKARRVETEHWTGSASFGAIPIMLMTIQEVSSCNNMGYAGRLYSELKAANVITKDDQQRYHARFEINKDGGRWVGAPVDDVAGCGE